MTVSAPPSLGKLDLTAAVAATFRVIAQRWRTLLVLALVLAWFPDFIVTAFPPARLDGSPSPQEMVVWLALTQVGFTLLAASTARLVLAFYRRGEWLGIREAVSIDRPILTQVFFAELVTSLHLLAVTYWHAVARLSGWSWLAAEVAVEGVYAVTSAFFTMTAAVVVAERLDWRAALVRTLDLTRGHRRKFVAFYVLLAAIDWFAWASLIALADSFAQGVSQGASGGYQVMREQIWAARFWLGSLFHCTLAAMLYLAVRKAREGVVDETADTFA